NDISLEGEAIDQPFGVETFLWLPTEDHSAPEQNSLWLGVHHINAVLARKGKLYVHCKNGHGRAPTLASAWLITQGMTTDEAVQTVQEKRQEAHIERVQIFALRQFEKSISKKERIS
ncbi:MAG: dual specificity protein phosphatase family protein, partial [bacterium]|nr:dual specificity protein phosphatase family protein [bacterium]